MNEELLRLKAKKRELERRIKELDGSGTVSFGRAKLDKEHYPTSKPDEWGIYIKRMIGCENRREAWYSIIRDTDRQNCINRIDVILNDLQGLKDKLNEVNDNGTTEI